MRNIIFAAIALTLTSGVSNAQSLADAFGASVPKKVDSYIFVSSKLSDATLVALARDAQRSGSTLVLNGYINGTPSGMKDTQERVLQISRICCSDRIPHWQVNPLLYQRYRITAVPSFVLAKGSGDKPADYTKVSGEMSLANALKFVAQESQFPEFVKAAKDIYTRSYATQ